MKNRLTIGFSLALGCFVLLPSLSAQSQGQIGSSIPGASVTATATVLNSDQTLAGPIAVPQDFSKLKIAPGFLLTSKVVGEPDLSSDLRVGDDGNVLLPLAGNVHVAGLTTAEATRKLEDAYRSAQILKDPHVNLDIAQFSSSMVTVLGEVHTPGRYQMQAPHSLLDVLSYAGGETDLAGGKVQLQRVVDGATKTTTYDYARDSNGAAIANVMLQDGDTVTVTRAGIVYVLGAVTRPGGYLMEEDGKLDVAQALSMASGTALNAQTSSLRIIRRKSDGSYEVFPLNYEKMVKGKFAPPQLQAQDIVYVPLSHIKASLVSASTIIGQTAAASIYATRY